MEVGKKSVKKPRGKLQPSAKPSAQDCKSAELKERCPEPGTAHLTTEKNPMMADSWRKLHV
jgi:hypothetical protein